jgi:hypothetical protein
MKRALIVAAVVSVTALAAPAVVSADVPSYVDRADAKRFARAYWEDERGLFAPCYRVNLNFHPIHRPGVFGYVRMGSCTVHMNSRERWNWSKLCTTVTHEYGHVLGRGHSSNPNSIMWASWPNPVWGKRFKACDYESEPPPEIPAAPILPGITGPQL